MRKGTLRGASKGIVFVLIHLYQHTLSVFFGPCCRFTPSCSAYALLSIQSFGMTEGVWLALKRFVKCHPWHPGGYDPVPEIPKNL